MKPHKHAKISAHQFGGAPEDYRDIHDFMDCSKMCHGDVRHRALLHNTLGCFIAERVFGVKRVNSAGREYSVRDVAEQHVKDDMGGRIPSVSNWLDNMTLQPWSFARSMGGNAAKKKFQMRYRIDVPDADPESEASSSLHRN